MKQIKNSGFQAVSICLKTPSGPHYINLKPSKFVVVSDSAISNQIITLAKRKRVQITNS